MAGVTLTRAHSWRGPEALQNKAADWIPWWAVAIGWYTRELVWDPYRAAGAFTVISLLLGGAPWWLAIAIGIAIPVLAAVGNWWAIIDPPEGGLRATGNRKVEPGARAWLREAWADIQLTWNTGRAWISEVRTISSQARVLGRDWVNAAQAAGLTNGQEVPELEAVRRTENGFAAEVNCGQVGVPSSALYGKSEELAASVESVREVIVSPGPTPGRALLEFVWGDAIDEPFGLAQMPLAPPGRLCAGLMSPNGKPLTLALLKSIFIAGVPGAGKSNEVQALLASARQNGIPHNLFLVDSPGGVELAELSNSPMTVEYGEKVADAQRVFAAAERLMWERAKRMAGLTREMVPSQAEPLCRVIVDEFLLHYELLAKGSKGSLGALMSNGRKYGFPLWGLSQDPTVDSMGAIRRLFVQKLVMAMESDSMTNAAFGDKEATSKGALCHLLDEERDAGMGYARVEGLRGFRKWRGPTCRTMTVRSLRPAVSRRGGPFG